MVERPADVLPMDKAQPVKMDGFGRFDMALRKVPGLGVLIVWALAEHWSRGPNANGWMLLGLAGLTLGALAEEYGPGLIRRFGVTEHQPATPPRQVS